MSNEDSVKKVLNINSGSAYLLKDREGMLDKFDVIQINSGTMVTSTDVLAVLTKKHTNINSGNSKVVDIKGDILPLAGNTVLDGTAAYKGVYVFVDGDIIIIGDGAKSFSEAEGGLVTGTLYYPVSSDVSCIAKITGNKRSYPDDAYPVPGDRNLEALLMEIPDGKKHIWVSGRVTALDLKSLVKAQTDALTISCQSLCTYESLDDTYGSIFNAAQRTRIPDGHEITGSLQLTSVELAFHGPKLYVQGDLTLAEEDISCLEKAESIIVTGTAHLSASGAQAFRKIGKAANYHILEEQGNTNDIDGFAEFSHEQLQIMVERKEQLSLRVDGCLYFADDVTPEDMAAIASLSYDGIVLIPGRAKGALMSRVKHADGLMVDPAFVQKMTGKTIPEIIQQYTGFNFGGGGNSNGANAPQKPEGRQNEEVMNINSGTYILI
ncbi:hypothetical protein FACS1894141_5000 [Spirochaetia bacterium]|nr:hypothetical protein FACS1894141_5000 [Spirochaetia bacterium]